MIQGASRLRREKMVCGLGLLHALWVYPGDSMILDCCPRRLHLSSNHDLRRLEKSPLALLVGLDHLFALVLTVKIFSRGSSGSGQSR